MFRFVFGCVLVLVALGMVSAASLKKDGKPLAKWPGFVMLGVAGLFMAWGCTRIVNANEVGVPTSFGQIGDPLQSGLHITAPWVEVTSFSTRVQELSMLAAVDEGDLSKADAVEVIAKGGGSMSVDTTIRWSVDKEAISDLFRQAGSLELVQQRFVRPDAREVIRNVFGQHSAEGGYSTERAVMAQEILEQLKAVSAPRGILVDSVNIRDVNPEKQVLDGINSIVASRNLAAQAAEDQKTTLTQAETRRQQAEIDAASQVLTAKGIADSQVIAAEAEAEANQKIAASLTPELLNLQAIQACADAIAQTKAAVVNCGTGTAGGGGATTPPAASVIVDQRGE